MADSASAPSNSTQERTETANCVAPPAKVKTQKELEKEAKKAAKLAKFEAKQDKKKTVVTTDSKRAEKKKKDAVETKDMAFSDTTVPGHKKVLQSLELGALEKYNPPAVESAWYAWWEDQGYFKPQLTNEGKIKPEGMFVITLPPPNVTGNLHIGHALTAAIQDTIARWNRMLGKTVLYLPGFDHAGIGTQSVVEKRLAKDRGLTRHDLGRKNFVNLVWEWKEKYHATIKSQLKRLGGSLDWSREAFTLSPNLTHAVEETFIRFHDENIIYRSNRLVHWCCQLNTALSNEEVDHEEIHGKTWIKVPGYERPIAFGQLTSFAYEIPSTGERIVIATTRPETMLGDTGIAVHPEDPRYKHLIGKVAQHPFIEGRDLPIVADATLVDMEFGTGAVKLTPAHDENDYDAGLRHHLKFINILNEDGTLNENAGPWKAPTPLKKPQTSKEKGQKRFDARLSVVEALKEKGLFVEVKDHEMTLRICNKSKDVIEPFLKPQWYVNMKDMAAKAYNAVESGELIIKPKLSEADFKRWMENIRDWCISRQLWWGHQAPVYFVKIEGETQSTAEGKWWISARSEEEAMEKATAKFPGKRFTVERDHDVLDTWFSSGLWPFSTMGWPNETNDMKLFYPNSMLETGWDILFFWVARMVMLGIKLTGHIPFKEVYCHPLVRDAQGRKMSKSLGNVIDPIEVIEGSSLEALHAKLDAGNLDPREVTRAKGDQKKLFPNGIPECGTDALRFALCGLVTGGRDLNLNVGQIKGYRQFVNKFYQATRFALLNYGDYVPATSGLKSGRETLVEKWILHRFNEAARIANEALEAREFHKATDAIYQYWIYQLCDVYVENSKPLMREGTPEQKKSAQDTLYTALEGGLKLLHPFMPFVTEELWQRLPRRPGDETPSIMLASYPVYEKGFDSPSAAAEYEQILGAVKTSRSLLDAYGIKEDAKGITWHYARLIEVKIQVEGKQLTELFNDQLIAIKQLIGTKKLESVSVTNDEAELGWAVSPVNTEINVLLLIKGRVNLAEHLERTEEKLTKSKEKLKKLQDQMGAAGYQEKVDFEVKEADEQRLKNLESEVKTFDEFVEAMRQMTLQK